jgi:hypothetical protein
MTRATTECTCDGQHNYTLHIDYFAIENIARVVDIHSIAHLYAVSALATASRLVDHFDIERDPDSRVDDQITLLVDF